MQSRIRFGVVLGFALFTASFASAVETASDGDTAGLTAELAKIDRSIGRLATALEQVLENQRVGVILGRIERIERRIAPLEARARDAEAEARGRRSEVQQFEALVDERKRLLSDSIRDGTDRPDSEIRQEISQFQAMHKHAADQLDDAERRVRDHDDRIEADRKEIAALDDLLAELVE